MPIHENMESVTLHSGFCVKSPSNPAGRWHERWCVLSIVKIPHAEQFYQKYYKGYRDTETTGRVVTLVDHAANLVFSYYEQEEDVAKDKPLNRVIIDNSAISDHHGHTHGYGFAIRIQLCAVYESRVLFLCFNDELEHGRWLKCLLYYMNLLEGTYPSVMPQLLGGTHHEALKDKVDRFISLEREDRGKKERLI